MNKVLLGLLFSVVLIVPTILLIFIGQFLIAVDTWKTEKHLSLLISISILQLASIILLYLLLSHYLTIQARQEEAAARLKGEMESREFQKKEREAKQKASFQDFENLLELYKRDNTVSFEAFTKLYDWYKHKNL